MRWPRPRSLLIVGLALVGLRLLATAPSIAADGWSHKASPDGRFVASVESIGLPIPAFPGQGRDGPGRLTVFDRDGWIVGVRAFHLLSQWDEASWDCEGGPCTEFTIRLVASVPLPATQDSTFHRALRHWTWRLRVAAFLLPCDADAGCPFTFL